MSVFYVLLLVFLQYYVEALEVNSMSSSPEARSFPRLVKLDIAPLSAPSPPTGRNGPPPPPPANRLLPPPPPPWRPPPYFGFYNSPPPPAASNYPSEYYGPSKSSYNSTAIVALPILAVIMIFICSFIWSHNQRVIGNQSRGGRNSEMTSGDTAAPQAAMQVLQGGKGLDRALLNKLPTLLFTEQKNRCPKKGRKEYFYSCAVCISDFEEGETLKLLPACGHVFHKDCIDMWLFSHCTCPLCRLGLFNNKGDLILLELDEEDDASDSQRGDHVAVDVGGSLSRSLDHQLVVSPLIKMFRRSQSNIDSSLADMARTRGLQRSCSQPVRNSKIHPSL